MRPISQFPDEDAARITTVFADIDDTLTTDGRLPGDAYLALEQLYQAGFNVAPVTGRPAGWCDMIARFWPVSGVVGENGAFYFSYDATTKKMRREYFAPRAERLANQKKLNEIKDRVLDEVPGCAVSADQAYRDVDMAIDFREDVAPLNHEAVQKIRDIFQEEGATAKISSIHVNAWFGDFDKLSMSRQFARQILGIDLDEDKDNIIFCGDSPNDAPMFEFFPNSCGVANVLEFKQQLEAEPTWITAGKGGSGFVELANRLLQARRSG
ncbi:MAG TPA: HAD-IIB family hydrolase [Rhizobiales bacterium]|nr:HAD-IIB family hydrolase [Hyphomicrobiales bacterium]